MPTYTFYIYSADILVFNNATGNFDFDASYAHWEDRYRIDVTDDDTLMDASGDANQLATVYDTDGNVVDSGVINAPMYAELNSGAFYLDRIEVNGTHYGYMSDGALTPGTSYAVTDSDVGPLDHLYFENNSIPCFGPDTQIDTPTGPRQITRLRVGDAVSTYDNGPQPVIWAGHRHVSRLQMLMSPKLRPFRFQGAMCHDDAPLHPLTLSANHRVVLSGPQVELAFGEKQVFAHAQHLAASHVPAADTSWHHILLPRHEVVRANGVWVESLFAGDALPELVSEQQRRDISRAIATATHTKTARRCLRAFEVRALMHMLRRTSRPTTRNNRVA